MNWNEKGTKGLLFPWGRWSFRFCAASLGWLFVQTSQAHMRGCDCIDQLLLANRGDERSISIGFIRPAKYRHPHDWIRSIERKRSQIHFKKKRSQIPPALAWMEPWQGFQTELSQNLDQTATTQNEKKNRRVSIIFQCWWMQASAVTTGGGTRLVRHFDPNSIARPCHQSCSIRIYDEAQRLRNA